MNRLITTDLHLTDNPTDEYRWKIFDTLVELAKKYKVNEIDMLGDCWDRKDRHSSKLVNKSIDAFQTLQLETKAEIVLLAGNHDQPLNGPYYWEFLDDLGIDYITKPTIDDVWYLPFSSNPLRDWEALSLGNAKAVFMHQTVQGAIVDGDRKIPNTPHPLPVLPTIPIFSGDVHRPQTIGNLVYVGTPHPIRYSETWRNRLLLVKDDKFDDFQSIWLDGTRRAILDISSTDELKKLDYKQGDQVRVRYSFNNTTITDWASEQEVIAEWAKNCGIHVESVEACLKGDGLKPEPQEADSLELLKPDEVVKLFADDEKLSQDLIDMGLELVKEST